MASGRDQDTELVNPSDTQRLIDQIADERDAAIVTYTGDIDKFGFDCLVSELGLGLLREAQSRRNILLAMTTNGGNADFAYKIARALQTSFESFHLYVPLFCKSAGTLMALGAKSLIMNQWAELGPIDVQLRQRDEIYETRSGLMLREAFQGLRQETLLLFKNLLLEIKWLGGGSVSLEMAANLAAALTGEVMKPIYKQVKPDSLGNDLRDLNVASEYAKRLVIKGKNSNDRSIKRLVNAYPSHDFVIDYEEASELFHDVELAGTNFDVLKDESFRSLSQTRSSAYVKRLDNRNE